MLDDFKELVEATYQLTNISTGLVEKDTEYFKNPISEIQYSLSLLKEEKYKHSYAKFIESLVYSNTLIPNYEEALTLIEKISQGVINSI
jgi:hypothetical protein